MTLQQGMEINPTFTRPLDGNFKIPKNTISHVYISDFHMISGIRRPIEIRDVTSGFLNHHFSIKVAPGEF